MIEREAIEYIENQGWSETRLGLDRTRTLLAALGNPQEKLRFVHVAGSNGKGSTCAMLDSILRCAGYRTGLYTSPYIEHFNERMRVNGEDIPAAELARITERIKAIAEAMDDHPSQFELVTAIAMQYFYERRCDIVVLEVGMGGTLDSTNVIPAPEAAVITNIGLEHTEYLGSTITEIAVAKAGIIKPGCSAVCYDGNPTATAVVEKVCQSCGVSLRWADFTQLERISETLEGQRFRYRGAEYAISLLGGHQLKNAAVVLETVDVLRARDWDIPQWAVERGLLDAKWPARLEVLGRLPLFILDGGHNPQCAAALAESLGRLLPGDKSVFLMGVLADKDYAAMADAVLPLAERFICVTPNSARALPAGKLCEFLRARGAKAEACESIDDGILKALLATGEDGRVVAFGSLYMAGAVRCGYASAFRKSIRKRGIRARDALSPEVRAELSGRTAERIAASSEFQNARTVLIYRAVRGELDLSGLVHLAPGKRYVYPLCLDAGEMVALLPGEDAWQKGAYGIEEPVRALSEEVQPEEIDMVICPCTAFDGAGRRMGMGAGYYDRYLPKCSNAVIAAVAFDEQRAASVPVQDWDIPMQIVFTPRATQTGSGINIL